VIGRGPWWRRVLRGGPAIVSPYRCYLDFRCADNAACLATNMFPPTIEVDEPSRSEINHRKHFFTLKSRARLHLRIPYHGYEREVPIALSKIQSVSHHEFVRNRKTQIIDRDFF